MAKQDAAARARSAFIEEGDAVGFAPAILSRFSTWIVVQVQPPPSRKHIPQRIYSYCSTSPLRRLLRFRWVNFRAYLVRRGFFLPSPSLVRLP